MKSTALISDCGTYRYRLTRCWDESLPSCMFIMLNPSTADDAIDDPTIKKCIRYAKAWGYGKLYVGNLFAYRHTDRSVMKKAFEPAGSDNRGHVEKMARKVIRSGGVCVAAWGEDGKHRDQDKLMIAWFAELGIPLHYLRLTKNKRFPCHPLYLPTDHKPTIWKK
jgi:hypothetical protein